MAHFAWKTLDSLCTFLLYDKNMLAKEGELNKLAFNYTMMWCFAAICCSV